MKIYILIISFFWITFNYGQNFDQSLNDSDKINLLWGDYYFSNNDYSRSINYYTQVKSNIPIGSQRNLANAYEQIKDLKSSKDSYEIIANSNEVTVFDYYKFANLLSNDYFIDQSGSIIRLAEEYRQKAFKLPFKKYSLFENDSLVFKKRFSKLNDSLINLKSNSIYSDFGAIVISTKEYSDDKRTLLFTSKQDKGLKGIPKKKRNRIESDLPIYNLFNTSFDINYFNTGQVQTYPSPINSIFQEGPGSYNLLSDNLYFTRSASRIDENNQVQLNLYSVQLSAFKTTNPILLSFNLEGYSTMHPSVSLDNTKIYFASDRPGGFGGMDLYYVTILKDGFSKPINLGSDINTNKDEVFPFIYKGKYLFFTSDGRESIGKLDIYLAQLIIENRWKVFLLGDKYNSKEDDFSFFMSEEQNYGFISSNRKNGIGEDDIYAFKFSPKIEGLEDNYYFSPTDTLIVASNGVMVNDQKNMQEYDPMQLLVKKKVSIVDSVKNGSIKFNENGTFLYKVKDALVVKDSFSYVLNSAYGKSEAINVKLIRIEDKEIETPVSSEEKYFSSIFYNYDKYNILTKYESIVDEVIMAMNENPEMTVEISSYTDCRGTKEYNLKLSKLRNKTIIKYIQKRIIGSSRIYGKGYGEIIKLEKYNCECCGISEEEHLLNRRTDFKIISF